MGFVRAGFLAALGAIAVPVIIHLVFARPRRRVDLGTLRFLRISLSESARRKWLKRWLLLALRMGAVGLLAILFARPFLFALRRAGDDQLVVMLIDRSGSMNLESTRGRSLDLAIDQARRFLRRYGTGTEMHLAFFDSAVRPVAAGADSGPLPLLSLAGASSQLGNSTTDYGAALAWARDICLQSRKTRKEIYLLTDLQQSGLGCTPAEPIPDDVRVHVLDFGQPYPRNAAVTRVTPSKTVVRPHESIRVNATVLNASRFALTNTPVVLHMQQAHRQRNWRSRINLEPGASGTVEFELPELDAGLWQGYVMVEIEDELPLDDRRYLAILVAPPTEVLAVDGDPTDSPITAETYFLEAALRLAPPSESYADSPYLPRVVSLGEGAQLPEFQQAAAIVLANESHLSAADAGRVAEFVQAGGGLLIFAGDRFDATSYRQLAKAGIPLGQPVGPQSTSGRPWRLAEWDQQHPVFQPFRDPQFGDLKRLAFRTFGKIIPADGARILAKFQDGSPALLERKHGRGRVLWFASTCDRGWSDWPCSRLFVPVIHQLLGYLVGLTEGGPIRARETDQFEPAEPPVKPGVYDRGSYHEIVNMNARESETDRTTIGDLARHFQFHMAGDETDAGTAVSAAGVAGVELRQDEIWYWVLLILFATLCAESFLANRTAG